MAKIEVPIQINLPDNWVEIVISKLKEDDLVEVIRCRHCKKCQYDEMTGNFWCGDKVVSLDHYCGYAEREDNE